MRRVGLPDLDPRGQGVGGRAGAGCQPGVVLDQEGGDPVGVRAPGQDAEQVASVAGAGADHAHRFGCCCIEVAVDLGADGREPVRQSGARPSVGVVPLPPVGAHHAHMPDTHRGWRRMTLIVVTHSVRQNRAISGH